MPPSSNRCQFRINGCLFFPNVSSVQMNKNPAFCPFLRRWTSGLPVRSSGICLRSRRRTDRRTADSDHSPRTSRTWRNPGQLCAGEARRSGSGDEVAGRDSLRNASDRRKEPPTATRLRFVQLLRALPSHSHTANPVHPVQDASGTHPSCPPCYVRRRPGPRCPKAKPISVSPADAPPCPSRCFPGSRRPGTN